MSYIYLKCLFLLNLMKCYHFMKLAGGWEYLNINCRDNSNEPVDWWYIYKPPSDAGPNMDSGVNFSYITPELAGRWKASNTEIYANSMLRYTLGPMFISQYVNYMGLVVYEDQNPRANFKGSASLGLMMANEMGGLWIGHTIPGFPDLREDIPIFPPEEVENGHIIMCLTLDLPTLNSLAIAVKQSEPRIQKLFVPNKLKNLLPDWVHIMSPPDDEKISETSVRKTKILNFVTRDKSLRGMILARSPGDSRCLYMSFAKTKGLVMDVYGHREHHNVYCEKKYGIRNVNSISIKYPEEVYYIQNKSDSMGFAVSTATEWQKTGINKNQYWTCTGNIENQPISSKGGIIACVTHFRIWLTFDNFKVKEPDCEV